MAYPGLKFVYNWADSEWIHVEIDDSKKNYFWPRMEAEDVEGNIRSFRNDEWDVRGVSYTYKEFIDEYWYMCSSPKELKESYLEHFENYITDSLFKVATSFLSYCPIWEDYDKISWYKACLRSAKKDIDMDSLIEKWNSSILYGIESNLECYYKYRDYENEYEQWDYYIDRVVSDIKAYRDFNKVKYKNFNIKNFIESKKEENIKGIIDFVVNWEAYFS